MRLTSISAPDIYIYIYIYNYIDVSVLLEYNMQCTQTDKEEPGTIVT